ncbi:INO80 complex subunit C [Varanus komodoensis]|nr:INO80 complex subunit C [Varanus komodoensis]
MSAAGTGELQFTEGTMNANMYCDILKQNMIPSLRSLGRRAVFQHENDSKHTSKMTTALLKKLRVKVMDWSSMSPDLNPIEHLWGILKWKVEERKVSNIHQLRYVIMKEWKRTPVTTYEALSQHYLFFQSSSAEATNENKTITTDAGTGPVETSTKSLPFKAPSFIHSGIGGAAAGKKNRTWKNLKQILASERALPWQLNDPSYFSIDAPPSFKPAKKYSDISGLPANYTDPQSKLRFSTIEEFAYIRMLPSDVVMGYLTLRKATTVVP